MPINDKQLTIAIIPLWLKMYDQAFLPAAKPTHPTHRQVRLYHGAPIHRLSPPPHCPPPRCLPTAPIPYSASAVQHSDTQTHRPPPPTLPSPTVRPALGLVLSSKIDQPKCDVIARCHDNDS